MHRDTLDDTSVVNEDVNLTYLSVDLLNKSLYCVLVGNVANVTVNVLDTLCLVVSKTLLKGSLVNVVKDNVLNACCNKSLSNVETNTVRSTGNPSILSFK